MSSLVISAIKQNCISPCPCPYVLQNVWDSILRNDSVILSLFVDFDFKNGTKLVGTDKLVNWKKFVSKIENKSTWGEKSVQIFFFFGNKRDSSVCTFWYKPSCSYLSDYIIRIFSQSFICDITIAIDFPLIEIDISSLIGY